MTPEGATRQAATRGWTPRASTPVPGSGFRVPGSGFRVRRSGFRVRGSAPRLARGALSLSKGGFRRAEIVDVDSAELLAHGRRFGCAISQRRGLVGPGGDEVAAEGLEPPRLAPRDPKSLASASFATPPWLNCSRSWRDTDQLTVYPSPVACLHITGGQERGRLSFRFSGTAEPSPRKRGETRRGSSTGVQNQETPIAFP